ncbi:MAG: TonB-dependent receptor [Algoriphagus sp.]|uniref:TonB-dependent receptor plug domain-containing protein n=1 Tax=Algoriphagus sp. TaxID=1872435 RepID=UPI0017A9F4D6|nr:TonB-dependent receptor [Algoriphagus sp.]NVJ87533.1 TonB-dependent receptor [Algoriphagus sp.]
MKKVFLMLTAFLVVSSSWAQVDSLSQNLEEIVIQENRLLIPFSKQSRNISIVTKPQLETSPARSLQEVLAFVPGVDVRQRGVTGVQADIGIRGGSFNQTLMLLNGIKLTDPQTGHHMMNIPVPILNIDRIEVLKGAGARIFGQNAYTGAVNVITRLQDQRSLQLQAYAGDFGMHGLSFTGSLPMGSFKQNLSFSQDKSNGHWYNSDYQVSNIFYEGGVDLNETHSLRGMIAYTDRQFGANGFYTSAFPDQWESIQTTLGAISHTYSKQNFFLNTRGYWRKNEDEYRLRRNEPEFYQNFHTSNTYALELNGSLESTWGKTGFGMELREENLDSNNLGQRNRTLGGVFLEQFTTLGERLDFRAGVYSNYFDDWGWKHFPGMEAGFQATEALRLYSNLGKSFRIPTYTDLYYVGPTNIGNADLLPEEAQNFEIGAKWIQGRLFAEAVYFIRKTDNLIEWARPDAATPWQPQNFNKVDFSGVELALSYRWKQGSTVLSIKEALLSYNYIHANLIEQPGTETRYALTALKNQVIGGLLLGIGKKLEWNTKMRYIERMEQSPYFLLDMRIDYNRAGKIGIFSEASNITNTDYIEAGTVQMPGRWFRAGFMLNLE